MSASLLFVNHRASRLWALVALLLLSLLAAACGDDSTEEDPVRLEVRSAKRGLIVLGIDGMDHELTQRLIREGRMPNLAKLAKRGAFVPLATTDPPQSPVAWSTFITGLPSEGHGIYDFVHRDPHSLSPYLSTSKVEEPDSFEMLGLRIPLSEGSTELLRRGTPFWEHLEAAGIPTTIYKIPANFPPNAQRAGWSMSGMGTPDILGTYGTFHVFSDAPRYRGDVSLKGGIVRPLEFDGQRAMTSIEGPPNVYDTDNAPLEVPVEIIVDRQNNVALLRIEGEELIMQPGEWSRWVHVGFDPGMLFGSLPGIIRFHLVSISPHLVLYGSPVNIDPAEPVMPIASPAILPAHIAASIGPYYTQGMPEDTKALAAGVLSDDAFLAQADLVYEERVKMLDFALDHYDGGLLFFYFSSIDQVSHVFWRSLEAEEGSPLHAYADTLPELYSRIDGVIGDVLERLPEGHDLMVLSDHGFAPYDWQVHLNGWLAERGYLTVREKGRGDGPLGHIDWSRTQAYALGLNQIFINLKGREPHGVVTAAERDGLLRRLERDLKRFRNPETGGRVVTRVLKPDPKSFPERAPDLLVGFARGHRSSDSSAIGIVGSRTIQANKDHWNGDHCMDARAVPGVLFTTWSLSEPDPGAGLADMAPTILNYFGVSTPAKLKGKSVFPRAR